MNWADRPRQRFFGDDVEDGEVCGYCGATDPCEHEYSEHPSLLESVAAVAARFPDHCWKTNIFHGVCLLDTDHDGDHSWDRP